MKRSALFVLILFVTSAAAPAQTTSEVKQTAVESCDAIRSTIDEMAMDLWDYAETALKEHRSSERLADVLREEGFDVEMGVAGMPTAFVATFGSGVPRIGVLAEYDALPSVGNEPVPYRERRGSTSTGHGCGHNLFGAGSVGGAIAIKRAMEAHELSGTVRLYGSPAEETLVGKVYMAKEGLFDDLDAALVWHPSTETKVRNQPGRAMNNFKIEFHGESAHGASDPWNGRSALDAVEMLNHGVNMMREHIQPTARIHYVIEDGGQAPNVVPDYARVWYYARGVDRESVDHYYDWILDIAEGAAQATQTEHDVSLITGVHETNLNRPLQEVAQMNLEMIGAPQFTDEEQAFARKLQENLGVEQDGYTTGVGDLAPEPGAPSGGSTDVAEVSYITPTVSFRITTAAANIPWHSWAATACHGRDAGVKGAVVAAKAMAATGVDLLTNPGLLQQAQEYFLEQTGGEPYRAPIPEDQKPPLPETAER
jgi:aminobenzoyl-glutamate utilization protein B